MEHRALGKGLSALIPEKAGINEQDASQASVAYVKTLKVQPNSLQPRADYNEEKLAELKASIKDKGVLQPILVREKGEGYEVVAGERRLRAAQALGLETIPVVIKKVSDQEALVLALVENIQREELNPIEEARAFVRLIEEFSLTQDGVAEAVGKDRSTISNTIRLLKLPQEIQHSVISGEISMGHARALLGVEKAYDQKRLFDLLIKKGLSVRELESLTRTDVATPKKVRKAKISDDSHEIAALEEELQRLLGTKVRVKAQKKRGKVVIEYYSLDDLERILGIIRG